MDHRPRAWKQKTVWLGEKTFSESSATNCRRGEDRPLLVERFDRVFATKPRSEWIPLLRAKGLMFGPVQQIEEVLDDPQALSNGYVVDFDHRFVGKVRIPGYPVQFSASRAGTRSSAPALGEHTDAILREIGYSDQEIAEARQAGVIR